MRRVLLCLVASCLLAVSCSSAPPKSETVSDVKNQAVDATDAGNRYYVQGRYDLALGFFAQALAYNTSVDNQAGIVQSYNSLGKTYLAMGEVDLAEQTLMKALPFAKGQGNEGLFFTTSDNLGELYLVKGDPRKAIELFEQALALPAGKLTQTQLGILDHDLGTAYKNVEELPRAMDLFEKSLAINLAAKLSEETAADYYMIASVQSKQGSYAEADKNLQLALFYDKKIENSLGIAKDLYALGLVAEKKSDAAAAYDYFRRSYLVYTTLGIASETKKALEKLIPQTEALGRTDEAADYRKTLAGQGN